MEDWLDKASSGDLGEEDYRILLEDLPADPALRKEWIDELKVVLSLHMAGEEKDAEWVRSMIHKESKKQVRITPIFLKSLAALVILSYGLSIAVKSPLFYSEGDHADEEVVLGSNKEEEPLPQDIQGQPADGVNSPDEAIYFKSPDVRGFLAGEGASLAKVKNGNQDTSTHKAGDELVSADELRGTEDLPMEVDLPEDKGAVLSGTFDSSDLPLDHLEKDPFGLEKKKKRRTMVASVGEDGPEARRSLGDRQKGFRPFIETMSSPSGTIPVLVGSSSYQKIRKKLIRHQLPSTEDVKVEEMINYFAYGDSPPANDEAFSISMELGISSTQDSQHLLRIGVKGNVDQKRSPANIVFLLDNSASMELSNSWGRVKEYLGSFWGGLSKKDRVSFLTWGGESSERLSGVSGNDRHTLQSFLQSLSVGGQVKQEEGVLEKAFDMAYGNMIEGGVNRLVMITDGAEASLQSDREKLRQVMSEKTAGGVEFSVMSLSKNASGENFLRELVELGGGVFDNVVGASTARRALAVNLGSINLELAKEVKLELKFNPEVISSYRLVGFDDEQIKDRGAPSEADFSPLTLGHANTALFEIVPKEGFEDGGKALDLRLTYREPRGSKERTLSRTLTWEESSQKSPDFQWAEVVAIWGRMIQGHPSVRDFSVSYLLDMGRESISDDPYGYRKEMLILVQAWDELRQGKDPRQLPMLQFWKGKNP